MGRETRGSGGHGVLLLLEVSTHAASPLEGKLYLANCIDLATREVIGWAMADHHRAELPVAALRMAAGRGGLEDGCIMYTDRGSEHE
ncbi:DDE-type integrase/transposase/recombinase [Streptomyces sp. AS58]|uniref:DDE-type integrase/transposase/recombinase n=1 Tax=Streptomyces sp. AS58 TaxID=1519489 RepID=UPI002D21B47D|nr:DDE-type integrase/transposase/recombinase [Streptomyces sp. AS58]